jgi:hypothetical protein
MVCDHVSVVCITHVGQTCWEPQADRELCPTQAALNSTETETSTI